LAGSGNFKPTDQMIAFKNEIVSEINTYLGNLNKVFTTDIPAFNALVKQKSVDAVVLKD
jgi:hypothetical protein